MKRLVVCCDGTWNVPDQNSPTNVVKLALAVAAHDGAGVEQRVFYHEGVGTTRGERLRGGVFGMGLTRDVRECYQFLVENYEPGDQLFFFGFSRGAFTARSVAGLVRNCGILRRRHLDKLPRAYRIYRDRGTLSHPRGTRASLFRRSFSLEPRIHFIGVFDTVGALGVPLNLLSFDALINRRWRFHDTDLSTQVRLAYQALSIDEKRGPFVPTLWNRQAGAPGHQVLEQVWFAGVHSDVGGGYADCSLAEIPLLWMADRAAAAGLDFTKGFFSGQAPVPPPASAEDDARVAGRYVRPSASARAHESRTGFLWGVLAPAYHRRPGCEEVNDADHPPTTTRWTGTPPWAPWLTTPGQTVVASDQWIASSARDRHAGDPGYAPPHLAPYLDGPGRDRVMDVRTEAGAPRQD